MRTNDRGLAIIRRYPGKLFVPVEECERIVHAAVQVTVYGNQFSALVSFVNSVGPTAFQRSRLLKYLNNGDGLLAASQFGYWVMRDGKRRSTLVERRADEKALFITPEIVVSGG